MTAERAEFETADGLHRHVSNVLRHCGHNVGRIYRVHSPGDLGAVDGESTTVLFVTSQGEPKTGLLWREVQTYMGSKRPVDRVRVLSGWDH